MPELMVTLQASDVRCRRRAVRSHVLATTRVGEYNVFPHQVVNVVADPEVSTLYGKVDSNEVGLFVTLGTFSEQAKKFASSKPNLRLVHGEEVLALIMRHYDAFDAQYQRIIPLKRVLIPVPIEVASG